MSLINKRKIVFTILLTFVAFISVELFSRFILNYTGLIRFIDDRTERHAFHRVVWIQRNQANSSSKPEIWHSFDQHHPKLGWVLKPNIDNMPVFHYKFLSSNSQGIRGRQEYSTTRGNESIRIAVIGDSFTFGEEVSDNETFSHYLETMIPRSEVINFGIHGYGHDQMLITLRDKVKQYSPDLVILGYIDSDDYRNLITFRDYAKPRYKLINGKLELTNIPIPSPEQLTKNEIFKLKTIDILKTFYNIVLDRDRHKQEKIYRKAIFDEIINEVRSINAKLVFTYLPYTYERFNSHMSSSEKELSKLYDYDNQKDLFYLSARPQFSINKANNFFYPNDDPGRFHWGKESHYTVAQAIHHHLQQQELLPKK